MKTSNQTSDITPINEYLCAYVTRKPESSVDITIQETILRLKAESVKQGDQAKAKDLWCLQVAHRVQNQFVVVFKMMQHKQFYSAWNVMERLEKNLHFLQRHFKLNVNDYDDFGLCFIEQHTTQFQELYPYRLFLSPGYIVLERTCTICGNVVSIRNPCGHIVGEIYDGEMCSRYTKARTLEMSFVTNPMQKVSVAFMASETGSDPYNYWLVNYVVERLPHPFSPWKLEWVSEMRSFSQYESIDGDDFCPCLSGKRFEECCLPKVHIELKHPTIGFKEEKPVINHEETGFVTAKSRELISLEDFMKHLYETEN